MITIKEIAQTLGLSTTTVSNVIHGKTKEVSQSTIEMVQNVLNQYEYVPNINARNLAQNKSKLIALAMKTREDKYENFIKDPFVSELIGGIEKTIRKEGYYMMIHISEDISGIIKQVSSWNTDGLLLLGMDSHESKEISEKYKKPFVLIDTYLKQDNFFCVGLEDEQGAYDITNYLISCGHEKITFVADNRYGVDFARYRGFCRAMKDNKLPCDEKNFFMHMPAKNRKKESFEKLSERVGEYTAFFCASDFYAISLMNEFLDRGILVPKDASIVGFDDNILAQLHRPALTTVHQDVEQKAEIATELLIQLLNHEHVEEKNIRLSTQLCIRDSVKILSKK